MTTTVKDVFIEEWYALLGEVDDAVVRGGWTTDEVGTEEVFDKHRRAIEEAAASLNLDWLARARHRWQHPTFAFGDGRCGCPGWAETIGEMLALLRDDEARALSEPVR